MSYTAKLSVGLICLVANFIVVPSVAQEASRDFAACKNWAGDSPRNSELGLALECLFKRIDQLETELRPFKDARGAVVSFDRKRTVEPVCPRGWSYFHPAGGRFIVGAGEHDNGLTEYPSFVEDNIQSVGGEEKVALEANNIPEVDVTFNNDFFLFSGSALSFLSNSNNSLVAGCPYPPGGTGDDCHDQTKRPGSLYKAKSGSNENLRPHNNMPPYIALYYCRKD